MKIYTKTGDRGTTSLVGGQRVPKNHPRLEAYGTIDELMAQTALLRDNLPDTETMKPYRDDLLRILDHLMRAASYLAVSLSHVCRTVCRRCERRTLTLAEEYSVPQSVMQYLNRLSDYFYTLGRKLTDEFHVKETYWVYDK